MRWCGAPRPRAPLPVGFQITIDGLAEIILEKDVNVLARYGGVKGVIKKLKADAEKGLRIEAVRSARLATEAPPSLVSAMTSSSCA